MRIRWFVGAVVGCVTVAFGQSLSPEAIDAAVMRQTLGQFWGGVVVGKDGKVVFAKGYGVADETLKPIGPDTLFDIGSVSKQFTAVGILRLEMDGRLSIDDPVAKYFPDLEGEAKRRAEAVTLKHLLTHTSGMTDSRAIQRLDFPDRDEAVGRALRAEPSGGVGEKFEYCNAGYVVLAAVIERAAGRGFEEFMREEIFKRAGLTSTGFLDGIGLDPSKQTLRVIGSRGGTARRVPLFASAYGEPWAWGLKGAGGVLTTIEDLVRWDAALRGEAVLNDAAKKKMYTEEQGGYALGWFVESAPSGGLKVQHGGATRGFRAQLSRYLDEGIVIAVLTNETSDLAGVERAVTKAVLPDPRGIEVEMSLGSLPMNKYKAVDVQDGLSIRVEEEGQRVCLTVRQVDQAIARISVTGPSAKALAGDLSRYASKAVEGESTCGVMIGTMPYTMDPENRIRLSDGLTWMVLKEYSGMNPETGQRIVDRRTTLVIVDDEKGFWPVIVKFSPAAAAQVIARLKEVAK